jgi:hypothetical protein
MRRSAPVPGAGAAASSENASRALVLDPCADADWLAGQLMTVEGGGLLMH